jgi:hypothetical protein
MKKTASGIAILKIGSKETVIHTVSSSHNSHGVAAGFRLQD